MGNGICTKYLRNSLKIRGRKPIATSSFRSSSYSDLLITQFFGSLSRRFGSHIITSRFYLKFSLNWANSNWFNKKIQKMQAHKTWEKHPPKKMGVFGCFGVLTNSQFSAGHWLGFGTSNLPISHRASRVHSFWWLPAETVIIVSGICLKRYLYLWILDYYLKMVKHLNISPTSIW